MDRGRRPPASFGLSECLLASLGLLMAVGATAGLEDVNSSSGDAGGPSVKRESVPTFDRSSYDESQGRSTGASTKEPVLTSCNIKQGPSVKK